MLCACLRNEIVKFFYEARMRVKKEFFVVGVGVPVPVHELAQILSYRSD